MAKNTDKNDKNFDEFFEFTDRLIPDPSNPNLKKVKGFALGKSDKEAYWRLYFNANLTHYLEFRKEDTVHAKQESSGNIMVWLKPESEVKEMLLRSGKLDFLKGTIVNEYLRKEGIYPGAFRIGRLQLMAADGSGCAHTGCSAGCTEGYGCAGDQPNPSVGFTCGC